MTTKEGREIAEAFCDGLFVKRKRSWTSGTVVRLHGNMIAKRDAQGVVWLSLAGHPTRTTRDRLNAICEAYGAPQRFYQWKGRQFYGVSDTNYVEISTTEWVPLAGPLGMLALAADRRAA